MVIYLQREQESAFLSLTALFLHTCLMTLQYAERGFPSNSAVRICLQRRNRRRHSFDPRVRKIPWSRKWQPTPVFLPEESHGQRSLEINSLQGCKESHISKLT